MGTAIERHRSGAIGMLAFTEVRDPEGRVLISTTVSDTMTR